MGKVDTAKKLAEKIPKQKKSGQRWLVQGERDCPPPEKRAINRCRLQKHNRQRSMISE